MTVFRRFSSYIFPYKVHIALVLLCTGVFVLFSSAAYWLAASFIQTLFTSGVTASDYAASSGLNDFLKVWTWRLLAGDNAHSTLIRAAFAIMIAFLGKNIFGYLQVYYVSFVEQRVIKDLRDDLFSHLLRMDLAYFHDQKRGHLLSTVLSDVETLNQALNKSFTKIIRDPVNALVLLILLFSISVKLTLTALIVVPLVGWTVQVLGVRIKKQSAKVQEAMAVLTGQTQEAVSGSRVVKAFSGEAYESNRYRKTTKSHYRSMLARERLKRMVIPLNEIVGVLIISALLFVGGKLVLVDHIMNSDDFVRFLILLFALLNPIVSLAGIGTTIRQAEASGERVFKVLDAQPSLKIVSSIKEKPDKLHSMIFKSVSFKYAEELPYVLNNLNFEVKQGEHLAIVGRSGSGKSTLVNLLPRFYDPTEGAILLNNNDLRDYNLQQLRSIFGIVTQQVILFHDTIAANIAYGDRSISPERIVDAAKLAFAHDFIEKLPEGYNTVVGEQGALFSGGQRQRISIARALLRNPEIVILDEATSALDPESADMVAGALDTLSLGRTVFTVTHRLASAVGVDRIIVLEEGKIIDSGKHHELMKRCKLYIQMAEQQKLTVNYNSVQP